MSAPGNQKAKRRGKTGRPVGYRQSDETRAKISAALRKRMEDPEFRKSVGRRYFKNATPEQLADIAALRSARSKALWANPEWAEKRKEAMRQRAKDRPRKSWPTARVERLKELGSVGGKSCRDVVDILNSEFPDLLPLTKGAVWRKASCEGVAFRTIQKTPMDTSFSVPGWVPQCFRKRFRALARRRGEEAAASIVRREKQRMTVAGFEKNQAEAQAAQ